MNMNCEFDYCIYNKEDVCILDNIGINQLGMCDSCEIVTISEKNLEKSKEKRLKEIAEIWKTYDKKIKLADEPHNATVCL